MKKNIIMYIIIAILIIVFAVLITIYFKPNLVKEIINNVSSTEPEEINVTEINVSYNSDELNTSYDLSNAISINLVDNNITTSNTSCISVTNNKVTIITSGTYVINGSLQNGQIIVDATKDDTIQIVLNNVSVTCNNSAPIYVKTADKVIITLLDASINTFTDGTQYVFENTTDDEPNGAIFSKEDLVINGTGTLNVNANYEDGIVSKDDLKIISGNIRINANDEGIRGKDSVVIKDGNITINCNGDGIKTTNTTETDKGYVLIQNGTINITAQNDGIQAETNLTIENGNITIKSGGGSVNSSTSNNSTWGNWGKGAKINTTTEETPSAKGIKANVQIYIKNGEFNIDSSDDSIHTNGNAIIDNGNILILSGDDGIHADSNVQINGGIINISKSYEGIEGANIEINDGNINIVSSDDGINVAGGNDGSSLNGRPGQDNFTANNNERLTINGGYIVVDASGDGLDSNGSLYMDSGTVIVNGPIDGGNGTLDYNGTCEINGGLLIAAGSSGMMQTAGNSSKEYCVAITYSTTQQAGTLVNIQNSNDESIITFAPSKNYQSIVICSPNFKKSETYTIYSGGNSTGVNTDGLYTNGNYSNGTKVDTFTISNIVTTVGNGGMGGMMNKGGKPF